MGKVELIFRAFYAIIKKSGDWPMGKETETKNDFVSRK